MTRKFKILRLEEATELPDFKDDLTPAERFEVIRLARDAFSADDLQKFTETDEGVSFAELIDELEEDAKKLREDSGQRPTDSV